MTGFYGVKKQCAKRAVTILDGASVALSRRNWRQISAPHLPFRLPERARSEKASASEHGVHEGLTFGAGLGWREAQRRGLGTAQVPNDRKAAEPLPVQPRDSAGRSILVRHHVPLWRAVGRPCRGRHKWQSI